MHGLKKMTAVLTAGAMMLGTAGILPVQNVLLNKVLTASADGEKLTEGIYELLTYRNHGDHIEITDCDQSAKAVEIPEEIGGVPVTGIGEGAFARCTDLVFVILPDSMTSIGDSAFTNCTSLTDVSMSAGLSVIGEKAFYNCKSLTEIDLPEGLECIGGSAFYDCAGLTSVVIPGSVTEIGKFAFQDCESLTAIDAAEGNARYSSIDGVLLDRTKLLVYPLAKIDVDYTIPEGVTSFEDDVFAGNQHLVSVTIPEGVTDLGSMAFMYCQNLTSVTIPGSVENIGALTFQDCTSLKEVTITEGTTGIQMGVFINCTALTSVTIPESVISIEDYAFMGSGLTDVYYDGTQRKWNRVTIGTENDELLNANIYFMGVDSGEPDYGDVDCNGAVNLLDVVLLNKNLMLGEKLSDQGRINADVDLNDALNPTDSLSILKYCVKLIELPVK